jgi:hypothetical protein
MRYSKHRIRATINATIESMTAPMIDTGTAPTIPTTTDTGAPPPITDPMAPLTDSILARPICAPVTPSGTPRSVHCFPRRDPADLDSDLGGRARQHGNGAGGTPPRVHYRGATGRPTQVPATWGVGGGRRAGPVEPRAGGWKPHG